MAFTVVFCIQKGRHGKNWVNNSFNNIKKKILELHALIIQIPSVNVLILLSRFAEHIFLKRLLNSSFLMRKKVCQNYLGFVQVKGY